MTEAPPDHTHFLWQLKLTCAYVQLYSLLPQHIPWHWGSPLLSEEYVRRLELGVWQFLWQKEETIHSALKAYLGAGQGVWSHTLEDLAALVAELVWYDITSPDQFTLTPGGESPL